MSFPVYDSQAEALIATSILAADFSRLGEQIKAIETEADLLHIDVMDGHFVPNISFGTPVMESIKGLTNLPFDVHLMISEAKDYIGDFVSAGASMITVHAEATVHLHRLCQQIREFGIGVGVSLNPATPLNVLEEILPYVDMILLMSVNPGFGGQRYIPETTDKIRRLRRMIDASGKAIHIEVDGGISQANIRELYDAGANVFVAGSAVFGSVDPAETIRMMKSKCVR